MLDLEHDTGRVERRRRPCRQGASRAGEADAAAAAWGEGSSQHGLSVAAEDAHRRSHDKALDPVVALGKAPGNRERGA